MNVTDARLSALIALLGWDDGLAAWELIQLTGAKNFRDAATIVTAWHSSHIRRARQKLEIS